MTRPKLSVIIVSYNTAKLTCACIESIRLDRDSDTYEILVVDNNSGDSSVADIKGQFEGLKLIEMRENVGFGIANNVGMEHATGEYILLLNSDVVVIDNAVSQCLNYLTKLDDNENVIIGCKHLYEDYSFQLSYYSEDISSWKSLVLNNIRNNPFWLALKRKNKRSHLKSATSRPAKQVICKVQGLYGSFLMFHRALFEKTKGFDPDFFLYGEESEWMFNRLRKYRFCYFPDAQIIHLVSRSIGVGNPTRVHQAIISGFLFWYKLSYSKFAAALALSYFNVICYWVLYPFFRAEPRYLDIRLKCFRYIFEIVRFNKAFAARPVPLKLKHEVVG